MQFNVHWVSFAAKSRAHTVFLCLTTSGHALNMLRHTQTNTNTHTKSTARGIYVSWGPSQELQYERAYIYGQAGRRQQAVSLSASILHILYRGHRYSSSSSYRFLSPSLVAAQKLMLKRSDAGFSVCGF